MGFEWIFELLQLKCTQKTLLREVKPKAFTYASSVFRLINRGALGSTGRSCAITVQDVGDVKLICRNQKSSWELEEVEGGYGTEM